MWITDRLESTHRREKKHVVNDVIKKLNKWCAFEMRIYFAQQMKYQNYESAYQTNKKTNKWWIKSEIIPKTIHSAQCNESEFRRGILHAATTTTKNWIIRLKLINDKAANGICFIHFQWKLCCFCASSGIRVLDGKLCAYSLNPHRVPRIADLCDGFYQNYTIKSNAFPMNRLNLFDGNSKILFFRP